MDVSFGTPRGATSRSAVEPGSPLGGNAARTALSAECVVLDVAGERCPCLAADGEADAIWVLGVADQVTCPGLGDLDAFLAAGAAAGRAPWAGQRGVGRCHACSLASVAIIAADSAGSRAWVTRQ